MRKIRIVSAFAFLIVLFINIDLSMNYSLLPELQDGITSHSMLQWIFGIFGDSGWTQARFLKVYEHIKWITFGLLVENVIVAFLGEKKLHRMAK